ncbi:hypothetical protein NIES2135_50190 [Leptolyngbya boryana NIES-2135]|jgi:predicted NACHT family NTPase|uniref:NACHT domain-containing protein n=1 Tax=Leptolyngbya boryana NIES-2135 TaxID=1973484 RepID=A0A1Z4JN63_LEPBY|nr:NACHT domain-containing NTPase [Leptolyngbya sp. FACHB-161]MBD2375522.1 NACHT domain-containing NTPase [Leptolyngbya sp. FACHB-238]MBD2400096.1 NACHT domain-containing NTPase [Leptolyngbya sp. FACHB-239]MBD2406456.1 NACHT domain-containing NTPase [Leptolyngbya sp. FACHB-402]BAS55694.1 NACHT nucleoside triphosphatase [Leptolyngbya boryana IAM M-101]BAS62042.1 NACHT nucleoside triphosphatase [Leptolyngbya boryana dg5]BAY58146.1 hypothetical protein NIES2135_50190 [Leptolyngbya boryana NIES-2
MASRSLQACPTGVEQIAHALTHQGLSQEKLAGEDCSSATSKKFCRGEKVDRRIFVKLCEKLDLNWEEIAGIAAQSPDVKIDASMDLVQKFRDRIRPHLQKRCGTMRVLDMSQPIGLDDIYTSVNILEKITGNRGLEPSELLQTGSAENIERFNLVAVKGKPILGLKAVEKHSTLMILGKPGAGKTTFLKHLAIQCISGRFQPQQVPIFITLKEFAESKERPDLIEYIGLYLECDETEAIRELLDRGNALILLDGLDEVRETDISHVLRQIHKFSERYYRNQFVMTCRIAACEYTFEQFTEVEVTDFDNDQIADFARKWFRSREDEIKRERFLQLLKAHPPIQELATSPLLLMLLCLVFEDSGDFPANRSELYQNSVDVLLKKWDVKRNIERDQIYKKLSLKRKEDLLSQIAYRTFKTGDYFFKQKDLERQIREFIENLPGASTDAQELELDSEAVLKSIEAQHGLFVERARERYSFSHLTFHEYFTAREIVHQESYKELVEHITDKRWHEVFLLVVDLRPNSEDLAVIMKQKIDSLLLGDEQLQQLLLWISKQYYLDKNEFNCNAAAGRALLYGLVLAIVLETVFVIHFELACVLDSTVEEKFHIDLNFARSIENGDIVNSIRDAYSSLALILADIQSRTQDENLHSKVDKLQNRLSSISEKDLQHWFNKKLIPSTQELRDEINQYLIEADFQFQQFSDEQKQSLKHYYDANLILARCLNRDVCINPKVRQKIEDALLLPIAEIQKL